MSEPIRILGVSVNQGATAAAAASVLEALGERARVVGTVHPELAPLFDLLIKLRHFNPDRATWRTRAGFNDASFNALSGAVERELRRLSVSFDLVFQVQTVFAPGELQARRPFVIYTDNIMSLTERFYPAWAALGPDEFRRWREHEARICRSAGHVLAWSDFLRDALIADYGCEPARVSSVGAGANLILPSIETRRWDSSSAIFVGRDFSRKGGHVLLDAWAQVRERLPQARLTVVGPPSPPAGADLRGIDWRGAVESRAELVGLYEAASAFVLPSLFEPWGHVFLEAMGCGLPCIGAAHCAMPEIVADGETGLLVAPGEPEPLADALTRLLADPALAEDYGRRAYASVTSRHRWSDVAARIAPALSATLAQPAPAPATGDGGAPRRRPHRGGRAQWHPGSSTARLPKSRPKSLVQTRSGSSWRPQRTSSPPCAPHRRARHDRSTLGGAPMLIDPLDLAIGTALRDRAAADDRGAGANGARPSTRELDSEAPGPREGRGQAQGASQLPRAPPPGAQAQAHDPPPLTAANRHGHRHGRRAAGRPRLGHADADADAACSRTADGRKRLALGPRRQRLLHPDRLAERL